MGRMDSEFRLPDRRLLAAIGNLLMCLWFGFGLVVLLFARSDVAGLASLFSFVARIGCAVLLASTARSFLVSAALNWRLWKLGRTVGLRVEQID